MNHTRWLVALALLGCSASPPGETPKANADSQNDAKIGEASLAKSSENKAPEATAKDGAAAPAQPGAVVAGEGPTPTPAVGPAPESFEGDDGLFGFRAADGTVVIPATYSMAMPFVDQVAAVVSPEDGWIFIDRSGRKLAKAFVFDNAADDFVEDRARIVDGDRYGFIASTGAIVVAPTWSFVDRFSEGRAAVCEGCVREPIGEHFTMSGGKWGYVDLEGTVVIEPRYSRAEPFTGGTAIVRTATARKQRSNNTLVIQPDGSLAEL